MEITGYIGMQQMEQLPAEGQTITYQLPRNILLRVLFCRMIFRRRFVRRLILFLVAAVLVCFAAHEREGFPGGYLLAIWCLLIPIFTPIALYRNIARAIDQNSQFTARKTVTFGPSRVVVVGPNFKSELDWDIFKGISEDDTYFFLHLTDNGFDSVIPKTAFTTEQQAAFRSLAIRLNAGEKSRAAFSVLNS